MNSHYARFIIVGLVFCLSVTQIAAQDLAESIEFNPSTIRPGISFFRIQNIDCIAASGDMVWVGTKSGLYTYNTKTCKAEIRSRRKVYQIEVVNGDVWTLESTTPRLEPTVKTQNIIRHFDSEKALWTTIALPNEVSGELRHFSIDGNDLWVGVERKPKAVPGMFLYHLDIKSGEWTTHLYSGLENRQIDGISSPAYDCANIIRVEDDQLMIFGEYSTYSYNVRTRDWHEMLSSDDKQAAVLSAFSPPVIPFRQQIGWRCTSTIYSQTALWFSSLGLPKSYHSRVLVLVINDPVIWLGTWNGLQRCDRSDKTIRPITASNMSITDLAMSSDAIWIAVQQKGLLRLEADQNWADFAMINVAEISDPAKAVTVEGLVITVEELLPQKRVWQVALLIVKNYVCHCLAVAPVDLTSLLPVTRPPDSVSVECR